MKIAIGMMENVIWKYFESKIDPDYTTKFSPISKKVKWQPLDQI